MVFESSWACEREHNMVRCQHGLPGIMCALCNRVSIEREDFHPQGEDDTPRFKKGRDSAKWVGRGESTGTVGVIGAVSRVPMMHIKPAFSSWALTNARAFIREHNLEGMLEAIKVERGPELRPMPEQSIEERSAEILAAMQNGRAIKHSKWNPKSSNPTIKHARNGGKATRRTRIG